jgi:hypothetical protein
LRSHQRAGVIALAAGSMLLGTAVAAQAAPAGAVTVSVNRLILDPAQNGGHAGSIRIVVRNRTSEPYDGNITITEAIAGTFDGQFEGASGCATGSTPDHRGIAACGLDGTIAPGASSVVMVGFRSAAEPQQYAQKAPAAGSVEVAGATASFPALFRATTGSLQHPRPYLQDTVAALAVTAGDVTLNRQADGSFTGSVPVTVRNNGDAPHSGLLTGIATPAGLNEWPDITGASGCSGPPEDLPAPPPGGSSIGCYLDGGQLAEGQQRTFVWTLTAPAGTPAGLLGTATTLVDLEGGPAQADGANLAEFSVTVAG